MLSSLFVNAFSEFYGMGPLVKNASASQILALKNGNGPERKAKRVSCEKLG